MEPPFAPAEIAYLLTELRCPRCDKYAEYHNNGPIEIWDWCPVPDEHLMHHFNMLEIMNEVK